MPNIKSAKKRVLVTAVKADRNKAYKSALRTSIKKANTAIETSAADQDAAVKAAVQMIDRSVSKGTLHKNTAARKKSALVLKLHKVQG